MSESNAERKEVSTNEPSAVEKRARWEAMSMTVCRNGVVNVRNDSYGEEAGEHVYSVLVGDGETLKCSCPADSYQPKCKHRIAVEQAPVVLSSASAAGAIPQVAADGGQEADRR